jgi:hypothetical protein
MLSTTANQKTEATLAIPRLKNVLEASRLING